MRGLRYHVAPEVFERYPGYVRGVVLAYGVTNGPAPAELVALLREAEAGAAQSLTLEEIAAHPRIRAWREAFRAFGARPSEYRSSVEALARRALRGDPLPSVNTLVDIGNVVSLRHLVPAGAHAIDAANEDLWLRPARGDEDFVALGSEEVEHPAPGEIVFASGGSVLTRRWVWRQGSHTLIQPGTKAVEYNVDGLPPTPVEEVRAIGDEIAGLLARFCGGRARCELLSAARPSISLDE